MSKKGFECDCNVIHHDIVDKVMDVMPNENIFYHLAEFFFLIGDETRCKIIFALEQQEMCVCDIANVLAMTKSSISHQLGNLRRAGVVKCKKVGKTVYYSLDDEHVESIFNLGLKHIEHKIER